MASRPDRLLELDGVVLACDDRGTGATPLVLVHGFTGGRIDFADVIDELATDRRVVAADHRGHAEATNTGDPASYTVDQLARDLLAMLDALGIDRCHLLGHSMGGLVVMRAALAEPSLVASLILMDTLSGPAELPLEWIDTVVGIGRDQGMGAVAGLLAGVDGMFAHVPEERRAVVAERTAAKLSAMDVEAMAALGAELCDFTPAHRELRALDVPLTVLVGEHDVLRAAADELAADLGLDGPVVVPDAAHSPQDENPSAWLAAVRAHLDAAERR